MIENPMIYLPILLLIFSNLYFATKYFKRKRRKRIMRVYGESTENRIDNLEDTITKALATTIDRLDKLEVDVTFMKDFTIKKKASQLTENIKDSLDHKGNQKPLEPKKKPRKEKKRMFTDKEIDQEIRAELGTILFLSPQLMKTQQTKAYRRLWYKANKNKNK